MNTTQAQQKALDDALVALVDRLEFGKCNMRLKTDIKPIEATFQVVLDVLALAPFYQAFLIIAEVPAIYMQEFWAIAIICPKIPGQRFEDPSLENDILFFLRDLGHTGDIHYITEGMFYNKNIDYVYLLWEDFLFQVENKETKKTNKMKYPRFTRIIIDYFMLKDQSISRRNKMFWPTAQDDTMFTTMRCVSRHEKTQVYGAMLPQHLTNQARLESIAYKTYYAYASGEKTPKPKYVRKKADSDTSPKKKTDPATKGSRLKSSAKVAKSDKKKQPAKMPKTKGLAVLSEVALTKAEQMKLATKRSKTQFHISHASGLGDGVNTQSKVPDEQQQKVTDDDDTEDESDMNDDSEETESDNDGDDLTHPKLLTYEPEDQEEEKADDEEVSSDQIVSTPPDHDLTKEEENQESNEKIKEGEYEEEEGNDMYRDLNLNLQRSDAKMTDAQANKDTEDVHVTLTAVPSIVKQQSSPVSSDLVSKFINPSSDTSIDSILNQNIQSHNLVDVPVSVVAETPSSGTTTPQPPIPNI
ncbi:hypothetical protein Tco_0240768 [Tanacetum coccineum]